MTDEHKAKIGKSVRSRRFESPNPWSQTAEITSDGRTVWINSCLDGSCIGRFCRFGIELCRPVSEQMAGGSREWLDYASGRTGLAEWRRFQDDALLHHGVIVSDKHMPRFLLEEGLEEDQG